MNTLPFGMRLCLRCWPAAVALAVVVVMTAALLFATLILVSPASARSDGLHSGAPWIPQPTQPLEQLLGCLRAETVSGCPGLGRPDRTGPLRIGSVPTTGGVLPSAAPSAGEMCSMGLTLPGDDWCERWVRMLDPAGGSPDSSVIAVRVAPSGSEVYVLTRFDFTPGPPRIIAVDPESGSVIRTIPLQTGIADATSFHPSGFEVSPDGTRLFVTGTVCGRAETPEGFVSYQNYLTLAYSTSGQALWSSRYAGPAGGPCGGPKGDSPLDIEVSSDGSSVYVTGGSTGTGDSGPPVGGIKLAPFDVATVRYDASTGESLWTARFDGGVAEFARHLSVSPDGRSVYLSAMSWTGESTVLAYRGSGSGGGELEWLYREKGDFSWPVGIRATEDRVVLAGLSTGSPTWRYSALGLTSEGERSWLRTYSNLYTVGSTEYAGHTVPIAMDVDGDHLYVTGLALEWDAVYEADGMPAMITSTVAFDLQTGAKIWNAAYRFPGERMHFATDVEASEGRVFVSLLGTECNFFADPGYWCQPSKSVNLVNVAYDGNTGSVDRVARYNHNQGYSAPANLSPIAGLGWSWFPRSAAGPEGTLYVAAQIQTHACVDRCYNWSLALFGY